MSINPSCYSFNFGEGQNVNEALKKVLVTFNDKTYEITNLTHLVTAGGTKIDANAIFDDESLKNIQEFAIALILQTQALDGGEVDYSFTGKPIEFEKAEKDGKTVKLEELGQLQATAKKAQDAFLERCTTLGPVFKALEDEKAFEMPSTNELLNKLGNKINNEEIKKSITNPYGFVLNHADLSHGAKGRIIEALKGSIKTDAKEIGKEIGSILSDETLEKEKALSKIQELTQNITEKLIMLQKALGTEDSVDFFQGAFEKGEDTDRFLAWLEKSSPEIKLPKDIKSSDYDAVLASLNDLDDTQIKQQLESFFKSWNPEEKSLEKHFEGSPLSNLLDKAGDRFEGSNVYTKLLGVCTKLLGVCTKLGSGEEALKEKLNARANHLLAETRESLLKAKTKEELEEAFNQHFDELVKLKGAGVNLHEGHTESAEVIAAYLSALEDSESTEKLGLAGLAVDTDKVIQFKQILNPSEENESGVGGIFKVKVVPEVSSVILKEIMDTLPTKPEELAKDANMIKSWFINQLRSQGFNGDRITLPNIAEPITLNPMTNNPYLLLGKVPGLEVDEKFKQRYESLCKNILGKLGDDETGENVDEFLAEEFNLLYEYFDRQQESAEFFEEGSTLTYESIPLIKNALLYKRIVSAREEDELLDISSEEITRLMQHYKDDTGKTEKIKEALNNRIGTCLDGPAVERDGAVLDPEAIKPIQKFLLVDSDVISDDNLNRLLPLINNLPFGASPSDSKTSSESYAFYGNLSRYLSKHKSKKLKEFYSVLEKQFNAFVNSETEKTPGWDKYLQPAHFSFVRSSDFTQEKLQELLENLAKQGLSLECAEMLFEELEQKEGLDINKLPVLEDNYLYQFLLAKDKNPRKSIQTLVAEDTDNIFSTEQRSETESLEEIREKLEKIVTEVDPENVNEALNDYFASDEIAEKLERSTRSFRIACKDLFLYSNIANDSYWRIIKELLADIHDNTQSSSSRQMAIFTTLIHHRRLEESNVHFLLINLPLDLTEDQIEDLYYQEHSLDFSELSEDDFKKIKAALGLSEVELEPENFKDLRALLSFALYKSKRDRIQKLSDWTKEENFGGEWLQLKTLRSNFEDKVLSKIKRQDDSNYRDDIKAVVDSLLAEGTTSKNTWKFYYLDADDFSFLKELDQEAVKGYLDRLARHNFPPENIDVLFEAITGFDEDGITGLKGLLNMEGESNYLKYLLLRRCNSRNEGLDVLIEAALGEHGESGGLPEAYMKHIEAKRSYQERKEEFSAFLDDIKENEEIVLERLNPHEQELYLIGQIWHVKNQQAIADFANHPYTLPKLKDVVRDYQRVVRDYRSFVEGAGSEGDIKRMFLEGKTPLDLYGLFYFQKNTSENLPFTQEEIGRLENRYSCDLKGKKSVAEVIESIADQQLTKFLEKLEGSDVPEFTQIVNLLFQYREEDILTEGQKRQVEAQFLKIYDALVDQGLYGEGVFSSIEGAQKCLKCLDILESMLLDGTIEYDNNTEQLQQIYKGIYVRRLDLLDMSQDNRDLLLSKLLAIPDNENYQDTHLKMLKQFQSELDRQLALSDFEAIFDTITGDRDAGKIQKLKVSLDKIETQGFLVQLLIKRCDDHGTEINAFFIKNSEWIKRKLGKISSASEDEEAEGVKRESLAYLAFIEFQRKVQESGGSSATDRKAPSSSTHTIKVIQTGLNTKDDGEAEEPAHKSLEEILADFEGELQKIGFDENHRAYGELLFECAKVSQNETEKVKYLEKILGNEGYSRELRAEVAEKSRKLLTNEDEELSKLIRAFEEQNPTQEEGYFDE